MPYKAKLTTRTLTASNVSADNLNKGSELTFQQADSNFLNLRDQSIGIAADDSTTIDIGMGNTLKVAGSGTVTTAVSGQTLTITGTGGGIGDLSVIGSTILAPSNGDLGLQTSGTGYVHVKDKLAVAKEIYFDDYGDTAVEPPGNGDRMRILDESIDINYGRQAMDSFRIYSRSGTGSQLYVLDVDSSGTIGSLKIHGIAYPTTDGTAGQVLQTDGAGQLSWTTVATGNIINLVGDDSTGTPFSQGETIKIAGAGSVTTAVSGDTLTITVPSLDNILTVVGDDSTGVSLNRGETLKIAGGTNCDTSVSGDTLTISVSANSSFNYHSIATPTNSPRSITPNFTDGIMQRCLLGNQAADQDVNLNAPTNMAQGDRMYLMIKGDYSGTHNVYIYGMFNYQGVNAINIPDNKFRLFSIYYTGTEYICDVSDELAAGS